MINAQNVAMEFHAALPAFSRPEHTEAVRLLPPDEYAG